MAYHFNFETVWQSRDLLAEGLLVTIQLSVEATILGFAVALPCAIGRMRGPRVVKAVIGGYIDLIRNTPFLVQLFLIYFGLPELGIRLTPNVSALLAMVVNVGAYATEIVRAGIESVSRGQSEAGFALGLGRLQILRYVILRPALRTVFPALTSQFIYLMLSSSVVSVISAHDLSAAGNLIQSQTFAAFEVYIVVTVIYFVLSVAFSAAFSVVAKLAFAYPTSR